MTPTADDVRHPVRRVVAALVAVAVVAWVVTTAYAAARIARGGGADADPRDPGSVGLAYREVSYAEGRRAWYVPGADGRPVVVVVHGYGNDRAATVEVGPPLHDLGYGLLFVDLGYVSDERRYGGGGPEAEDLVDATTWARRTLGVPVVLLGFSAGALASLAATADGAPVAAVISDSGFLSFRDAVAYRIGVGRWLTGLLPAVYPLASGGGRLVDLSREIRPDHYRVPTLVIQGDADETIPPAGARRIAALTGGRLWTLPGVGHTGAFHADRAGWVARVDGLVRSATQASAR